MCTLTRQHTYFVPQHHGNSLLGRLTVLTNKSGHYKPGAEGKWTSVHVRASANHLHTAVDRVLSAATLAMLMYLEFKDVDLSEVRKCL